MRRPPSRTSPRPTSRSSRVLSTHLPRHARDRGHPRPRPQRTEVLARRLRAEGVALFGREPIARASGGGGQMGGGGRRAAFAASVLRGASRSLDAVERPRLMDTSRVDGGSASHDGTPSRTRRSAARSASPNAKFFAGECRDGVVEREEGQVPRFLTARHYHNIRQLTERLGRRLMIILIAHRDPYDRSHVPQQRTNRSFQGPHLDGPRL